jgi:hypothetical protein
MKANLYHMYIDDHKFPIEVLVPSEWADYEIYLFNNLNKSFVDGIAPPGYEVKISLEGEFHYDPNSPFGIYEIISGKGFSSPLSYSTLYEYINDVIVCGHKFSVFNKEDLKELKKLVWGYFNETGFNFVKARK